MIEKVVLIILIVIIVIFIILLILFSIQKNAVVAATVPSLEEYFSKYKQVNTWSSPESIPGDDRSKCLLYNFPAITSEKGTVLPGQPTLNPKYLDYQQGKTQPDCVDDDQIVARRMSHTCEQKSPDNISYCFKFDGTKAQPGESEIFYTKCNIPHCVGELAVITLYNDTLSSWKNTYCLNRSSCTSSVLGIDFTPCDIANTDQIFRVLRKNPGDTEPNKDNNGILMQFVDRSTGKCLVPAAMPIKPGVNVPLVMDDCKGRYPWAIIPGFKYNPSSDDKRTVPEQFAYIEDVKKFPTFKTNQDIIDFIRANNLKSMRPASQFRGPVLLVDYDFRHYERNLSSAKYLNYGIYNSLRKNKR